MIFSDEEKENYIYQDDQNISCWNRYLYPHKCTLKIFKKKYQEKWENAYLTVKNARASRAPRAPANIGWLRSPDYASLRRQKISGKIFGPPDQILDPLLGSCLHWNSLVNMFVLLGTDIVDLWHMLTLLKFSFISSAESDDCGVFVCSTFIGVTSPTHHVYPSFLYTNKKVLDVNGPSESRVDCTLWRIHTVLRSGGASSSRPTKQQWWNGEFFTD